MLEITGFVAAEERGKFLHRAFVDRLLFEYTVGPVCTRVRIASCIVQLAAFYKKVGYSGDGSEGGQLELVIRPAPTAIDWSDGEAASSAAAASSTSAAAAAAPVAAAATAAATRLTVKDYIVLAISDGYTTREQIVSHTSDAGSTNCVFELTPGKIERQNPKLFVLNDESGEFELTEMGKARATTLAEMVLVEVN